MRGSVSMEDQLTIHDAIDEVLNETEESKCPYDECDGSGTVTIQTAPDDEHTRKCRCAIDEEYDDQQ